ncbi:MAG: PD-(D/E)XK nuclease family protein [Nanoarchaeota archaeon]
MNFKLSPSALNLMLECPRCFWLTQHKVWKRPAGIFPSLPSGMDRVLKEHFDRFMEKGELPPELCENDYCQDLKLFDDKSLLDVWRSNFKGISFTDEKGNILHGAVDNILMKEKKLIVLDYKTRGYPLKEDTHKHYQLQMDIYNFLLRKNSYKTEDYTFLLFYYPNKVTETGEVVFDTKLIKMETSAENGEKVWNDALKLLNKGCPQDGCGWCELIKNG